MTEADPTELGLLLCGLAAPDDFIHNSIVNKHWKIMGKFIGQIMAISGPFLWKRCLNNRFKSSGELFCFDLL